MTSTRKYGLWALSFALPFVIGCKSPFDSTRDASNGGGTGQFSTNGTFVIFSSELVTGGGAFEYPGGQNQSLSFSDTSNPISRRSIRYSWTGGVVNAPGCTPDPTPLFAGFDLMYTPTLATYNPSPSVPGRDLHKAGYTKATFYARGGLSTDTVLKVEVAASGVPAGCPVLPVVPCVWLSTNGTDDDGTNSQLCGHAQLTGGWQQYTISIPNSALTNVKDFFKATFVFNQPSGSTAPGQGGTAYFDQIQYQP
jgi:hypothetical protein